MKRLIVSLLAILILASADHVGAQAKKARIGLLVAGTPTSMRSRLNAFRQQLKELGWTDGQNIDFEYRYAEGKLENLTAAATELIALKVDILVASSVGVPVAKRATNTIPIVVMGFGED